MVLISHDRALLSDVATTMLDLDPSRDGKPRVHGGGFAGCQEGRRAEQDRWTAEYEQQQAEHARLMGPAGPDTEGSVPVAARG